MRGYRFGIISSALALSAASLVAQALTASITPKTITCTPVVADKVYDGTTSATITSLSASGVIQGDVVSCTGGTGTFATKQVGSQKPVSVTGIGLTGAAAANYTANATAQATASITKKSVTVVGLTAQSKVYDGTTAATLTAAQATLSGAIPGDVVTLTGAVGTFADPNVGQAKPVTVSGLTLAGADAGNYTLGSGPGTAGGSTPPPPPVDALTISTSPATANCPVVISVAGQSTNLTTGADGTAAFPYQGTQPATANLSAACAGMVPLGLTVTLQGTSQAVSIGPLLPVPPATAGLLTVSKLTVAGCFLSPGLNGGGFTTSFPTAMRREADGLRHYVTYDGLGELVEYPEPALSPCTAAPAAMNRATYESWGGNWGIPTINASGNYVPGQNSVYAMGLTYDPVLNLFLLSGTGTYSNVGTHNSVTSIALDVTTHKATTVACWGLANVAMAASGSGVVLLPPNFVSQFLPPGARYGVGTGGEVSTVGAGISEGPSLFAAVPPPANGCEPNTDHLIPSTVLSNYSSNAVGPTCYGVGLGCTPTQAPTPPFPEQIAATTYSLNMYPVDWDSWNGHGWAGFGAGGPMTSYDDGVLKAFVHPLSMPEGWMNTTVVSSTSPTAAVIANPSTHDGLTLNPGDKAWIETCTIGVDGPGCAAANNNQMSQITVSTVSAATGAITFTVDYGDGGSGNHVPVPGGPFWMGCIYAHGEPTCSRWTWRMQMFDPAVYAKVIAGNLQPYEPVASDDQDINDLITTFGSPASGSGVSQHGVVSVIADPSAHQIILVVTGGLPVGCCAPAVQFIILNVNDTSGPTPAQAPKAIR